MAGLTKKLATYVAPTKSHRANRNGPRWVWLCAGLTEKLATCVAPTKCHRANRNGPRWVWRCAGSTKRLATCVAPTKNRCAYGSCRADGDSPNQRKPTTPTKPTPARSGCRSDASRELFHSFRRPIAALPPPTAEKPLQPPAPQRSLVIPIIVAFTVPT